jgi:hypothetical protein
MIRLIALFCATVLGLLFAFVSLSAGVIALALFVSSPFFNADGYIVIAIITNVAAGCITCALAWVIVSNTSFLNSVLLSSSSPAP